MKIIVDSLAVEYMDEGQGPILLMLHGWANSLHSFDAITALLSPNYRVIRLDIPGFGESELPPHPWYTKDYVECVRAFLAKLNVEPYAIVGHSFGGRITIKGVGTGRLQPQKIILIDSAGNARRDTPRVLFYKVLAKVGKAFSYLMPNSLYTALRKGLYRRSGSDYLEAGALSQTFLNTVNEDLTNDAERIKVPALLLWGERDTMTPLEDGKRLAAAIPNARLEVFASLEHAPHREQPEKIVEAITSFL